MYVSEITFHYQHDRNRGDGKETREVILQRPLPFATPLGMSGAVGRGKEEEEEEEERGKGQSDRAESTALDHFTL